MLCSVVKHLGSGRALKKWGKTLDCVSCFPLHFFRALPLPACFTTEQSAVEASLFVNYIFGDVFFHYKSRYLRGWVSGKQNPWDQSLSAYYSMVHHRHQRLLLEWGGMLQTSKLLIYIFSQIS